jgi:hypothetical protein
MMILFLYAIDKQDFFSLLIPCLMFRVRIQRFKLRLRSIITRKQLKTTS